MVALNFDRGRPETMLNLNEVAELRGWSRRERRAAARLRPDVRRDRARPAARCAAGARRGGAHGRLAADPQPRHDRRQSRRPRRPPGDALPPLMLEDAEVECASVRGVRTVPLARVRHRREAQRARARRADHRRRSDPVAAPQTFMKVGPRNAMVIAVVSLAVSAGDELRASFGSASPRPVLVTAPRDEARRLRRACRRRGVADRRRARHRALPPACAAGAHRARAEAGARMRITLAINGEEQRGRLLGGRVAALRAAREARLPRARRTPASRASAARARCCSTARSSARASCSPRRPTATT